MHRQFTLRVSLHTLRRGAANVVIFVVCATGVMCALLGGIWAYTQILAEVWNAIFRTHTAPGELGGVVVVSLLGLAVLVYTLHDWLKRHP